MREYLFMPTCTAQYFSTMRQLREFIEKHGLHLKRTAKISGLGMTIGEFMIDPDPKTGGYYLHHHHAL